MPSFIQNTLDKLRSLDLPKIEDLVTILTLVLLAKHAPPHWYARGPITILCIAGLIFPSFRYRSGFWMLIAAFLFSVIINRWYWVDNHKYLEAYWALSLGVIFGLPEAVRRKAMELNGAFLLGGCMILAVLWKLVSIDYVTTRFFEFTLLTDSRFETFASLLGRISDAQLSENRHFIQVFEGKLAGTQALNSTVWIGWLSIFMTWWTVLIEGTIGVLFMFAPKSERVRKIAIWILIVFAVSTYAVATVKGFAWLLLLMCLVQTRDNEKLLRLALVFTFLLIQFYTLPFGQVTEALTY